MTRGLHRFFVGLGVGAGVEAGDARVLTDARVGSAVVLTGTQAHQISRVLRLKVGQRIVLLDGHGHEFLVRLDEVRSSSVTGHVEAVLASRPEPSLRITLYQALVPRDRFETVLQKGTEVGITRFVPTWCERSIVPGGDAADEKRLDRWRRIVTEAAEQCERGVVPEIARPLRFAEAMAEAAAVGSVLVAWERERARSIRAGLDHVLSARNAKERPSPPDPLSLCAGEGETLTNSCVSPSPAHRERGSGGEGFPFLALFVGPEGGLTDAEIAQANSLGALTVSLGPRILRTETAGPVLAALALYEAGDLDPVPDAEQPA